ncbi:MAG: ATP synthase F0 subunit B [Terracidiphilus sp.]
MSFNLSDILRSATIAALAVLLAFAPYRALAQSSAPVTGTTNAASTPSSASTSDSSKSSDEDQEQAFLHSPMVQSIARVLHLNVNTTSWIFLGINFAVIFFAIVIPLGRVMPRIFRKRSQTLSHDLKTAREATADANSRLSAIEAKLAGLGEEIKQFRDQVERDSLEDERRIKASISEESARIVAAAEQEITVAAAQARRGLRNFAAELAIGHAEKQLKLTPETDRALIAEFVAGVSADGAGKGGKN